MFGIRTSVLVGCTVIALALAPSAWSKKPAAPAPAAQTPPAATTPAADAPARVAEYRHLVMEAIGGHTRAIFMIIKGESSRTGDVVVHASAIDALAALLPALFPAGSDPVHAVDTDAKPEIWTNPEGFAAATAAFKTRTAALVEAAKGGDKAATQEAAFALGGSCGECHDAFRVDEEHH